MNKKTKTATNWLAAAVFLAALALNAKVTLDDPFVLLSDEAVAQTNSSGSNSGSSPISAEWGGWSNFSQGQGFWKDELAKEQPCPIYESSSGSGSASGSGGGYSGSASGSGSHEQVNPSGRTDVRCIYGNTNCTSAGC
ncbi:MAG: hypothetical protein ACK5HT_06670 [Draconibacterium sp.]